MTLEVFISKKNINETVLLQTLQHKQILCNITPYKSIVLNKKTDIYEIQPGYKLELFNIGHNGLISLWDGLRQNLKIHCMYIKDIDTSESYNSEGYKEGFEVTIFYEGCITQLPEYLKYCKDNNIKPLKCSEY